MDIKKIASIANKLDNLGLTKEADILDSFLEKIAQDGAEYTPYYAEMPSGMDISSKMEAEEKLKELRSRSVPTTSGDPAKPLKVVTHGPADEQYPRGRPYYAAKPETINQFKSFLTGILNSDLGYNYKLLQSGRWDDKEDDIRVAFAKFAELAGAPDAGASWTVWANKSGNKEYTPNIQGIYNFWKNNVDGVYSKYVLPKLIKEIKEKRTKEIQGLTPTIVRDTISATPAGGSVSQPKETPSQQVMVSPNFNIRPLRNRIYNCVTGGSGIQIGAAGEKLFSTFTGQVMRRIQQSMDISEEAKAWFSQSPDIIIPDRSCASDVFTNIYTGNDQIIKDTYDFIQEASNAAQKVKQDTATRSSARSGYYR